MADTKGGKSSENRKNNTRVRSLIREKKKKGRRGRRIKGWIRKNS